MKVGPAGDQQTRNFSLWITPNSLGVQSALTLNGTNRFTDLSAPMTQGEWNHIAATYDGSTLKFYVNGVLSQQAAFSGTVHNGPEKFYIGGLPNGAATGYGAFKGSIADVRLYNYTQTADQIQSTMRTPLTGGETGLVYNTHFGLDANGTVLDITSTPNPGTLAGQAQVTAGIRFDEDTSHTFSVAEFKTNFLYRDPDGDAFAGITVVSLPAHGSLALNGVAVTAGQAIVSTDLTKLVYTPEAQFNGVDTFTWQASDGSALSNIVTLSLTVTSVNDLPVITAGAPSATLVEAGGLDNTTAGVSTATIALTTSDADGNTVTFNSVDMQASGWSSNDKGATYTKTGKYGTATLTASTQEVSYQLNDDDADTQALTQGQSASDSFSVSVTDGSASAKTDVVFNITGSKDNNSPALFDPGAYLIVPNASSYVEIPDAPNLRVTIQTVSMWVKPNGVSSAWQPLLTKSGPGGEISTRDYSLWIVPNTLNVHHSITLNGANNPYNSTG